MKSDYAILGCILTVLPLSVLCFLVIVLVKVICLHAANDNRRRSPGYGAFVDEEGKDEDADSKSSKMTETENVVGIYFDYMNTIEFKTYP